MARQAPERLAGLFFFDFVYPGIGPRMAAPDRLNHIWYQSFHQMEMAPALVGASRESCRLYIGHFLKNWSHRKDAFDDVLDAFADNFFKAGNLAGGFAHYRASHAGRVTMMKGEAPQLPPIDVPTCVRWAEHDPLFPYAWTDRLGETFTDLDLAMFPRRRTLPASRGSRSRRRRRSRRSFSGSAGAEGRQMKRVGPPDAVNTGGPVPLIEILAGKGGFAGQREATIRP